MAKYLLALLLLSGLGLSAQPQIGRLDSTKTSHRTIYTVAEQYPEFPGGMNKLRQYWQQNLRYPQTARQARQEGKVFVSFVVTEQGAIEEVRALNSLSPELDAEAIRLVQSMPNWVPGKVKGKAVSCRYNLPINFSL